MIKIKLKCLFSCFFFCKIWKLFAFISFGNFLSLKSQRQKLKVRQKLLPQMYQKIDLNIVLKLSTSRQKTNDASALNLKKLSTSRQRLTMLLLSTSRQRLAMLLLVCQKTCSVGNPNTGTWGCLRGVLRLQSQPYKNTFIKEMFNISQLPRSTQF